MAALLLLCCAFQTAEQVAAEAERLEDEARQKRALTHLSALP